MNRVTEVYIPTEYYRFVARSRRDGIQYGSFPEAWQAFRRYVSHS